MCFGPSKETSTSQQTLPPELQKYYEQRVNNEENVYNQAQDVVNSHQTFQPYTGQRVAGFNDDQQNAFNQVRDSQGLGQEQFQQGIQAEQQAGQAYGAGPYQQQAVQLNPNNMFYNGYNVHTGSYDQSVNPQQVGTDDFTQNVSKYMNPYIQQSLDPQLKLMDQQLGIQNQQTDSQAAHAGAFGGDRTAVAKGLNAQNTDLAKSSLIGNAYNNAYTQAAQTYQNDASRQLQAQGMNQNSGLQAYGLNSQNAQNNLNRYLQADMANQNNNLSGFQANVNNMNTNEQLDLAAQTQNQNNALAGYQTNYNVYNTDQNRLAQTGMNEAQLGQGMYGLQNAQSNALLGVGAQQQQNNQANLDVGYSNYQQAQQYPYQNVNFLNSTLQSQNMNNYGTGQVNNTPGPNQAAMYGGLGIAALGTLAMFSSRDDKQPIAFEDGGEVYDSASNGRPGDELDHSKVLDRLSALPVDAWTYKSGLDPDGTPHMGTYAEDFHHAFGLGDGKTIPLQDIIGTLHSAVKGLNDKVDNLYHMQDDGYGHGMEEGEAMEPDMTAEKPRGVLSIMIEKRKPVNKDE